MIFERLIKSSELTFSNAFYIKNLYCQISVTRVNNRYLLVIKVDV